MITRESGIATVSYLLVLMVLGLGLVAGWQIFGGEVSDKIGEAGQRILDIEALPAGGQVATPTLAPAAATSPADIGGAADMIRDATMRWAGSQVNQAGILSFGSSNSPSPSTLTREQHQQLQAAQQACQLSNYDGQACDRLRDELDTALHVGAFASPTVVSFDMASSAARAHLRGEAGVARFTEIDDHLLLGGQPDPDDLTALRALGVTRDVSIRKYTAFGLGGWGDEHEWAQERGMAYSNFETAGIFGIEPEDIHEQVELIRHNDGRVYLHCLNGRDRSAVVATSYAVATGQMTPDQAWQEIMLDRGHDPTGKYEMIHWSYCQYLQKYHSTTAAGCTDRGRTRANLRSFGKQIIPGW